MNLSIFSLPKSYILYFLYNCSIIKFYKRSVGRALLREKMVRIRHSILGFFTGVIVIYIIILSFYLVNSEAALMLIVFDFLFVSLVFPLDGSFVKKIGLLLIMMASYMSVMPSLFKSPFRYPNVLADDFNHVSVGCIVEENI